MATESTGSEGRYISTDRETVRKWADRHNAVPVRRGSDETLDLVHEYRVDAGHERLDWNTFYDELDRGNHAVSYRVDGLEAPGIITQEQAVSRSEAEDKQIRNQLVAGETVTSTLRETSAVETPVIEEATVESELVDREIVDEKLLDVDLVERTCTDFVIVSQDDFVDADTFDHDRYFASLAASRDARSGGGSSVEPSLPYTTEDDYQTRMNIREVWTPTREVTERFTVESRITGTDVAQADTLDDYDLDVTGLQRSIIEEGMLDGEKDADEAMRELEIESELDEGETIHTHFTRTSTVEDEVIVTVRIHADVTDADSAEMDFTASDYVVREEATETMRSGADGVTLTTDDVGKAVADATGTTVGKFESITDGGQTAYVDPHSSATERIMSAFGSTGENDRNMEVYVGQFADTTHDEIRLKTHEQLAESRQIHGGG
ncbi:MAG: hypothetical protein ABEI99_05785 [Halobaculum sp.]